MKTIAARESAAPSIAVSAQRSRVCSKRATATLRLSSLTCMPAISPAALSMRNEPPMAVAPADSTNADFPFTLDLRK